MASNFVSIHHDEPGNFFHTVPGVGFSLET